MSEIIALLGVLTAISIIGLGAVGHWVLAAGFGRATVADHAIGLVGTVLLTIFVVHPLTAGKSPAFAVKFATATARLIVDLVA